MQKTTVLASLEDLHRSHCIDIFTRPDGTFGFEVFRRDSDGCGQWQSLGKFSHLAFGSGEQALDSAKEHVPWLNRAERWRW